VKSSSGGSLVESLVVVAIGSALMVFAVPAMKELVVTKRMEGIAVELATDIQYARGDAVARNRPLRLRVQSDAGGSCYLLYTGSAGDCSCSSSGLSNCTNATQSVVKSVHLMAAGGVHLQSNVPSMLFDPHRGIVSPTGSLTLSSHGGKHLRQIVNILGRSRTCSPDGTVAGYPIC
jgi:type IV fimbrial biogenesis protein FimT